ncbi:MAG: ABC transporter permease [Pseudobdellovibrionaceae bacterium]
MTNERSRPKAPKTAKAVLWISLILLYLPIVVMILGALFVIEGDQLTVTFKWFADVMTDESLMDALGNSLIVSVCSSVLATLIGTAGALGLRNNQQSWRKVVEGLSTVSLIFPEIVFALSLLSLFFLLHFEMGLKTVILAHVTFSLSYVLMTVTARLATMDPSLEDAARDLGASEWQVQKSVIIPLLKPAILGGFILSFLLSFDDFLITYFVNGVGQDTLPVKLYSAMKMGVSPKLNALSSLMFLTTLLLIIFFFRSPTFRILFEGGDKKAAEGSEEEAH